MGQKKFAEYYGKLVTLDTEQVIITSISSSLHFSLLDVSSFSHTRFCGTATGLLPGIASRTASRSITWSSKGLLPLLQPLSPRKPSMTFPCFARSRGLTSVPSATSHCPLLSSLPSLRDFSLSSPLRPRRLARLPLLITLTWRTPFPPTFRMKWENSLKISNNKFS